MVKSRSVTVYFAVTAGDISFLIISLSFISEDTTMALAIYAKVPKNMKSDHPYQHTEIGKRVVLELESKTDEDKIKLVTKVIQIRSDSKQFVKLPATLSNLNLADNHMANYLLKGNLQQAENIQADSTQPISGNLRQATEYVGGSIIRSLRKVKILTSDQSETVQSWEAAKPVNETSWTRLQDRGELLYISACFLKFLIILDSISTSTLSNVNNNLQIKRSCYGLHT